MTPAPANPSAGACLQTLARLLADQLDAARRGRLDGVARLAERVDACLADTRRAGVALSDADRRHLLDLHGRVRLALAQQQAEVGRQRERVRKGKRGVGAYAASSGNPEA